MMQAARMSFLHRMVRLSLNERVRSSIQELLLLCIERNLMGVQDGLGI